MKLNRVLIPVIFFILMCVGAQTEAAMNIVFPKEDVWVSKDTVQIVGILEGENDRSVSVNVKKGTLIGAKKRPVTNGAFSCEVKLGKGKNRIIIQSRKSKKERTIYYAVSDKNVPKGLKQYHPLPCPMEMPSCKTCHQFKGKSPSFKKISPTTANCTDGSCHAKIATGKYVHGPLGAKICVFCHNPHGSFLPDQISRPGKDLCLSCHQEEKRIFREKVMMQPVKEGNCVVCHDPHKSSQKFQLLGSSLENLCFMCHDKKIKNYTFLHGPMEKGACIACHLPHSSPYKGLIAKKQDEFCYSCHKERLEQFKRRFTHKPSGEDCNSCHTAHGSNVKFQLEASEPELCYECHKKTHPKVVKEILNARKKHKAMEKGKCSSCHTVHSTNFEKQLKAPLKDICFTCHEELKEEVDASLYKHGAVKENNCNACHTSHGAVHDSLLKKYFTPKFYTEYTDSAYALCFECHNKNIVQDEKTNKLTDFRNGSTNLHYLHVNRKKGRTCTSCHEVHAGNQGKHVREEVPFGEWSYPIQFTASKNGGSCVVGCHKPRSYDRR